MFLVTGESIVGSIFHPCHVNCCETMTTDLVTTGSRHFGIRTPCVPPCAVVAVMLASIGGFLLPV